MFTTRTDCLDHLCETLGLDRAAASSALDELRPTFGRWEDLEGAALERLERRVWDRATDGAEWPWDESRRSRYQYRAAREMAHGSADSDESYPREHVLCVAERLGAASASQCAEGEEWEPADWLQGDADAIREAAADARVTLDPTLWRECWGRYTAPSLSAYDVQGLARRL